MNQRKSENTIGLNGRTELFDYLKKIKIFFPQEHRERIDKRIRINIRDLGLNSYEEYLELIKRDQGIFDTLIKWLKRGKIYNTDRKSFTPLITQKSENFGRTRNKKMSKRKRTSRESPKHIEPIYPLQFPDPQDIENIPRLFNFLASKNINHEAYKEKYFLRRIWNRMMRTNATSYSDYLTVVKDNPTELNRLLDTLSINVTRFFRDIDLFTKLQKEILPKICGKKENMIRAWSAGCAVGAEPYSIAIMISKIRNNDLDNVRIFATDICQEFLNQAKKGVYSADLLTELNQSQMAAFFSPVGQGLFQIDSKIRNSVTFKQHDLKTNPPFKDIDLILCRNVLIYFSRQESERLFGRFYGTLKHDGYLVLGKCELIPASVRHLFTKIDARARIYQRV
ncbi:MAG: CheR family methyltransferase [Candidatus Hodarchaeota archaeon]